MRQILSSNGALLVLTGFMGTGKSSVGQAVADRLGLPFVDMDALIEAQERQSIASIFETYGEVYFRQIEAALAAKLAAQSGLVIATGGGTLIDPRVRKLFESACVVCLDATVEALVARLDRVRDRPMLAGGLPRERIEALLAARRVAYSKIPIHVDTTDKPIQEVVDEIVALFQSRRSDLGIHERMLVRSPAGEYPVVVGTGLLESVGSLVPELSPDVPCAVITNPTVGSLYAERVVNALQASRIAVRVIEIPDGEGYKNLATVQAIYDQLVDARLERQSTIFALGGGVVGDIAGFVAATFLRGIPFVQLPTTLLAMVDASIGGKTAVDHPRGKNLIGAFKQPKAVIADVQTLATLPPAEWRAGMAEFVKHALIGDPALFARLESDAAAFLSPTTLGTDLGQRVAQAMRVKVKIIEQDPLETGERIKLNLGHTFAHALEKLSGYSLRHGDAVAMGLVCAGRLAQRLGLCHAELVTRLEEIERGLGLPAKIPSEFSSDALVDAMEQDKKRVGGRLRFVLPRAVGDIVTRDNVPRAEVIAALDSCKADAAS